MQQPHRFIRCSLTSLLFLAALFAARGVLAQDAVTIVGSGSNLPRPLYDAWTSAFNQRDRKVQARYLPIGTVESIKQISNGSGDFGGGEVQLTNEEFAGTREKLVALPVALVAVVPIYNLPGDAQGLRFTGSVLADIYLGKVHNWNDPEIASLNPGVKLPSLSIEVFHRAEGKGANYILTDYLSKVSAAFRQRIGKSASPKWVLGRSAMRNEDMADQVGKTQGAIGYVELNYAAGEVSFGSVQNVAGKFVKASKESVESACAAALRGGSPSLQASLTNAPGENSYPIASFTYIYLRKAAPDKVRASALASFLDFVLSEGQNIAASKNYAKLPEPLLQKVRSKAHALATGTAD
jgi:phosphate transport system substrate-binding protein